MSGPEGRARGPPPRNRHGLRPHVRHPDAGCEEAVSVVAGGATRTIDAGRVAYRSWDGSPGPGLVRQVASAGMSGAVAQRANSTSKAMGGKASFLWATLAVFARWKTAEMSS